MEDEITVLIADDHPMVRAGLRSMLSDSRIRIVGEANNGREAFEMVSKHKPAVLLMDIRHPMRPFDQQMIDWCHHRGLSCHVVLTKADKLKRGPAQSTLLQVRKSLPPGATAQTFSASKGEGKQELIALLNGWYEIGTGETGTHGRPLQDRIETQATGAEP
jgi:CheY-like chemotaxis protein